jgi:excisionase family DNA binding protein
MTTFDTTDEIVVVHGRGSSDLDAALELAGMRRVIVLADLRVWMGNTGTAGDRALVGAPPDADAGPERLLLTVTQAASVLGIGRTMAYQLIREGQLEVIHVGRCTRIPADTLPDAVTRLRTANAAGPGRWSRQAGRLGRVGAHDESQLCAARTT